MIPEQISDDTGTRMVKNLREHVLNGLKRIQTV